MRLKSTLFTRVLLLVFIGVLNLGTTNAQWQVNNTISDFIIENLIYPEDMKTDITFINSDIGYVLFSPGSDTTYFFYTSDKGITIELSDTVYFHGKGIEYGYDWGLVYGKKADIATVSYFSQNVASGIEFQFADLKEFQQVNIVNEDHAVFQALSIDDTYIIGLFNFDNDQLVIENQNAVGTNCIKKIDFFNETTGWYLSQDFLYKTTDLGASNVVVANDVEESFDFYNLDTGVYFADSRIYSTTDGSETWIYQSDYNYGSEHGPIEMNSIRSFFILSIYPANSYSAWVDHYNLYTDQWDYHDGNYFDGNMCTQWVLKSFSEQQTYVINTWGNMYYTLNNAGVGIIDKSNINQVKLSAYPNPAVDKFSIEFHSEDTMNDKLICIYNVEGQLILKTETKKQSIEIDMSDFESGLYLVNVLIGNKSACKKVKVN